MSKKINTKELRKTVRRFKIGDEVHWDSQANGIYHSKQGKIVAIIQRYKHPFELYRLAKLIRQYNSSPIDHSSLYRNHESYLVAVEQPGKTKPKLYWPRVSALRKKVS